MNVRRISILLACCWVILVASTATAGVHSHGHGHSVVVTDGAPLQPQAPKAVSPFDAKLGDKRLHCELLGHSPLLPCPHHKVPAGGKEDCYIANECGGGPFQAPSSRSFGDSPRFLVQVVTAQNDSRIAMNIFNSSVLYDFTYFHSLDRPPRAL